MGERQVFSKFAATVKKQIDRTFNASAKSPENNAKSKRTRRRRERFANSLKATSQQTAKSIRGIGALSRHPKFWLYLGIGVGVGGGALLLGWEIYQLESQVTESVEEVLTYAPPETITIESADGAVLQEIGPVTHETLKSWQVPKLVQQAFIASEDRRFEEHGGVDFQGILRAAFANLLAGEVVEGGSTITQQLARITFLSQERTFGRKYREMRLAQKIERELSKPQILERYLNLVYLGSGAYGVADASWVYFSKPASKLNLAEAATLAGIVPAPSNYSPLVNPQLAKQRQNLVLQKMADKGSITQAEAKAAMSAPISLKPSQPKRLQRLAPYFTDYIFKELPQHVSPEVLKAGGITVETTLNAKWQKAAEDAIETTTSRYGRWQGFKQAALVAIDPRNGQIKAMVGGDDYAKNQYNRVTQAKRQPGSTFKTFIYTTALAAGFSPNRTYLDAPFTVAGYTPENYGDKYRGGPVSLYDAIAASLNVVTVQLLLDVGWNPVIQMAKKMGIESELQPTYSLALGAWEVNLLELTSAYGTLANRGVHQKPYGISRILDSHGQVLYQAKTAPEVAVDPDTSALMTWMLEGVVQKGTGRAAQIGRPVAGKTGTSDKARDLWFVGYIPQLVAGVWLGNDNNRPTSGASSTAAATWRDFMLDAVAGMPIENFPQRPKLEGRKATVKAEPIKGKRPRYNQIPAGSQVSPTQENRVEGSRGTERRKSRRRRRRVDNSSQPAPQTKVYSPEKSTTSRRSRRQSAPAAPQAAPAPAPAAAPAAAPLAPPAARKGV
jgi:penicillin-binding protein 1A